MRDVPDVTRQIKAVCARHRLFLERPFQCKKAASKLQNDAYFANLYWGIKSLRRSDLRPPGDCARLTEKSLLVDTRSLMADPRLRTADGRLCRHTVRHQVQTIR